MQHAIASSLPWPSKIVSTIQAIAGPDSLPAGYGAFGYASADLLPGGERIAAEVELGHGGVVRRSQAGRTRGSLGSEAWSAGEREIAADRVAASGANSSSVAGAADRFEQVAKSLADARWLGR